MIVPVAAVTAMLIGLLVGGRPDRLARVRVYWVVPLLLALAVQTVVIRYPFGPDWLPPTLHVLTYVAAGAFLVRNLRIPGFVIVALGAASNGIAIAANRGVLPASPSALRTAGISATEGFANSWVVDHPRLAFLGDVFAVPAGWPLANVFSIGDVLIVLGSGYAVYRVCGTRFTPAWDPRAHGHGPGRHAAPNRTDGAERRQTERRDGERRVSERRAARERAEGAEARTERRTAPERRLGRRRAAQRRAVQEQAGQEQAGQGIPAESAPAPTAPPPWAPVPVQGEAPALERSSPAIAEPVSVPAPESLGAAASPAGPVPGPHSVAGPDPSSGPAQPTTIACAEGVDVLPHRRGPRWRPGRRTRRPTASSEPPPAAQEEILTADDFIDAHWFAAAEEPAAQEEPSGFPTAADTPGFPAEDGPAGDPLPEPAPEPGPEGEPVDAGRPDATPERPVQAVAQTITPKRGRFGTGRRP